MKFVLPKYWSIWIFIGFLFLLAQLPMRVGRCLSWFIGWLIYYVDARHRRITLINLGLCFPKLDDRSRKHLAIDSFRHIFFGVYVLAGTWFASKKRNLARVRIHGRDRIERILNSGKSVMLIGSHQSCQESTGMLGAYYPMVALYRKDPNELLDAFINRGRQRFMKKIIPRDKVRKLVSEIKKNQICGISLDQDVGINGSVFATFFGVLSATSTLVPRIQKINPQTEIVTCSTTLEGNLIHIRVSDPITFKTNETMQSKVTKINELAAEQIGKFPSQYLWQHRRFKTQPEGVKSPYE